MSAMKIKKGDTVRVIAGKDKFKEGKVSSVDKKNNKVTVEGVNMRTKHTKPSAQNQNGGIVTQEGPIDASNELDTNLKTERKFVLQNQQAKLLIN